MITHEILNRYSPFLGHRCNITIYRSSSTLGPVGSRSRSLLLIIEKWFPDDNSRKASKIETFFGIQVTRYMTDSTLGLEGSMSRSLFLKIEKWFLDDNSLNTSLI